MIQIVEINVNIFYIFRRICVQNSFGIILTLTHLCPGYPKISIILVYDTSTNNLGINHELTEKKEGELFGFWLIVLSKYLLLDIMVRRR